MSLVWPVTALGEVALIGAGNSAPQDPKFFEGGSYPFIRTADVGAIRFGTLKTSEDHLNEKGIKGLKLWKAGTILLPKSGASTFLNHRVIMEVDGYVASHLATIVCRNERVLPKYVLYFLRTVMAQDLIQDHSYPSLRLPEIGAIRIPVPSIPEQKRIISIVDEAFKGIDTAITNAEKNIANAQELFESFLSGTFSRLDRWVERNLADASLMQIIDGDRGANYPSKADFSEEGYCLFLNTKNVRPDGFNFNTKAFITEKKDKELRKGKLKRRDVVLTTRGTIGNIALYDDSVVYENVRINSGMIIFRPNEKIIKSEYLFELLRSGIVRSQISRFVSGAAQPQLPIHLISKFVIPVPTNIVDQEMIVTRLNEVFVESERLNTLYRQKLASLIELKQAILQKAFAGELTMPFSTAVQEAAE